MSDARIWVVSGMSGAGKATALAALERDGVECVDNLPADLLGAFTARARSVPAAAVVDARQPEALARFVAPAGVRVVFLDARDDVLVRRLAESTRPHPCAEHGRGRDAVSAERILLEPLRAAADIIIDTSELDAAALSATVTMVVAPRGDGATPALTLTLSSFGFKFGLPLDADWIVDARMIRNPFWEPELRALTGLDDAVRAYVLEDGAARGLVDRLQALLEWTSERYLVHGRRYAHVAVGCTGGRHRSVVIVEELSARMRVAGIAVHHRHRDCAKPDLR